MIRIDLSVEQVAELQAAFAKAKERKLRDRLQMVLMAQRGRPHGQIAADLGVAPRTLQRHLRAYLEKGISGLVPRKAPGAAGRIPVSLAPEIRGWVIAGPQACGLDRANWTHAELAEQLRRVHGIRVKKSAMHRFCRGQGIRPYRPSYRDLRGDPAKQAQAQTELAELKKLDRQSQPEPA